MTSSNQFRSEYLGPLRIWLSQYAPIATKRIGLTQCDRLFALTEILRELFDREDVATKQS